jgi:putative flippase GtrA
MKKPEASRSMEFSLFQRALAILTKRWPWIPQFVSFGVVGLTNLLVAYSIYALFVLIGLHPQIANAISFVASVINAYLLNNSWVFKRRSPKRKSSSAKFAIVYGGNYLLGVVLLYLYFDVLHLNKYLAPFLSLPITVPANYLLNKYWVFAERRK